MNMTLRQATKITMTLTSTLLMTGLMVGCASTAGTTSTETTNAVVSDTESSVSTNAKKSNNQKTNYSLPEAVLEGYWAVIKPASQQNTVVSLRKTDNPNTVNTTLYEYACEADGSYQEIETHKAVLTSSKKTMLMTMEDENEPFSTIEVLRVAPKKAMVINQGFLDSESELALPDGLNFVYIYTDELKPLCAIVDKDLLN